ncbi:aryl-phospho-beta-D-glucosidase BglC (GH1 family) [Kribbella rubisoli]|uniref:Aryl-phospho-beta-D-glucosidase BglC (GH1 family) n=1 Tax=Kribbella rubisoli TaxID=3075929 RepID=A0A4Q7X0B9_9ACTN|nr:cellulase family glycosylhydrolase [Kribbella rubisoli]RZU16251.1 aryl-phospho-beta-D-glucosidase BglC (GH1 family) [Kribbella rubisoli]
MTTGTGNSEAVLRDQVALRMAGSGFETRSGRRVRLRGVGLGGWLSMENFITGYPATEDLQRQALREVLGDKVYDAFFDRFYETFFADEDAAYLASLGLNCVRIAVNYRHFEDDERPKVLKDEGLRLLDRAIETCARHGLYTIIDLHAAPGFQNQRWHSDNPTHVSLFWRHRDFQDRVVHLWEALADRYRANAWVAGYNLLNEPAAPTGRSLATFYSRLHDAVRAVDPDTVIFLDGNRHATDFALFGEPRPNTVYSVHDYALAGFADSGKYPGVSRGRYVDRETVEATFLERTQYMLETGTPIWVGEFGPVYSGDPEQDESRYAVLRDQLEIYDLYGAGWSLWTYKDIGLQGLVHAAPDSPYLRQIAPVLAKKARLGVDAWGSVDTGVRQLLDPIEQTFDTEFPDFDPLPFGRRQWIATLVRHIMLAEPLVEDFARSFAGLGVEQVQELADSFRLDRCLTRDRLATAVRAPEIDPSTSALREG